MGFFLKQLNFKSRVSIIKTLLGLRSHQLVRMAILSIDWKKAMIS